MGTDMKELIHVGKKTHTWWKSSNDIMCGPPLNVKTEKNCSSHKTDTVFQHTNFKCTMYVDTESIPELLQVLTVTWLQYLAKYLLNNWGLLLLCGPKFTLWCLWEEFPVGRELRRTWERCQWAAETTACLHFLPNPIESCVHPNNPLASQSVLLCLYFEDTWNACP